MVFVTSIFFSSPNLNYHKHTEIEEKGGREKGERGTRREEREERKYILLLLLVLL
jgi:hypothetical protein